MIHAIFAIDETNGMGFNGSMPWPRNKQDLMWFKRKTSDNIVVMGKRTWESSDIPLPLPNRTNVLVTNNFINNDAIIQVNGDICDALLHLDNNFDNDVFVIGGPNILMQSLPVIEKAYITRIPGEYINDTFINLDLFLQDFKLTDESDLGTCIIQEYNRCKHT